MKILMFTERNDWEGETWNFYIRMNDDMEKKLRDLITNSESESYSLSTKEYTEQEVKDKIKNCSNRGYMPKHQDCGTLSKLPETVNWEEEDPFYKGQIRDFCVQ